MTTIYVIKMTESHEQKTMVKFGFQSNKWNGIILRSYKNRKEATKYARMCNKNESRKFGQIFYFTVEEINLY